MRKKEFGRKVTTTTINIVYPTRQSMPVTDLPALNNVDRLRVRSILVESCHEWNGVINVEFDGIFSEATKNLAFRFWRELLDARVLYAGVSGDTYSFMMEFLIPEKQDFCDRAMEVVGCILNKLGAARAIPEPEVVRRTTVWHIPDKRWSTYGEYLAKKNNFEIIA